MYMFFWFFKQLYYILRRFTKHKFLLLLVFFVIAFFLFIKPIFAFTPYTELSYIESSGTQYIDTGLKSSSNLKIEASFSILNTSSTRNYIFGVKRGDINRLQYSYSNLSVFGFGNQYNIPSFSPINTNIHTITLSNGVFKLDGTTIKTLTNNSFLSSTDNLYLFGMNDGGTLTNLASIRLYYCKIWRGEDLIRDYIPVRIISNNEICLYDKINDSVCSNNGTGVFVGGSASEPYIVNNYNEIVNFSFNDLNINALDLPYDDYYELVFTYPNNLTSYTGSINNYKTQSNGTLYFNIPREWITSDIVVRNGARISFDLYRYHRQEPAVTSYHYNLGYFDLTLTEEEETTINEDSNKQLLSDINKTQQQTNNKLDELNSTQQETNNKLDDLNTSQEETTNAVNNLNNTITDTNIDNNSINLPSDNSTDITQEGLNGIFTSIYNAFCTGQPQDIVFPVPFTNKSITLQPNYVRQMLTSSGATWVITIIEAFWWYLISRYIIKDITNKITKIKSGNIEDIENSNIKGDML